MRLPIISTLTSLILAHRFVVRGSSMEPAFRDGDCLLVDRQAHKRRTPVRGEVVVLRLPLDEQAYLKRVVGLPEEWVRFEPDWVVVDGEPLDEPYVVDRRIPNEFIGSVWYLCPEDYLVLGDTRSDSLDSRRFGPVGIGQIEGPVLFRYWPISRWGAVRP